MHRQSAISLDVKLGMTRKITGGCSDWGARNISSVLLRPSNAGMFIMLKMLIAMALIVATLPEEPKLTEFQEFELQA